MNANCAQMGMDDSRELVVRCLRPCVEGENCIYGADVQRTDQRDCIKNEMKLLPYSVGIYRASGPLGDDCI
eukprot:scaffold587659_cov39-Prasinocladus_malaysianus.AAC.1